MKLANLVGKEIVLHICEERRGTFRYRGVRGRVERSRRVKDYGYRVRFNDLGIPGHIGLIFDEKQEGRVGGGSANHIVVEGTCIPGSETYHLKHTVQRCPGNDSEGKPWNSYIRCPAQPTIT